MTNGLVSFHLEHALIFSGMVRFDRESLIFFKIQFFLSNLFMESGFDRLYEFLFLELIFWRFVSKRSCLFQLFVSF